MALKRFFIILACITLFSTISSAEKSNVAVNIGVLAFRSSGKTLERWKPTSDRLTRAVGGYNFNFIPMNYPDINLAVQNRTVDFILTNTGHYVELAANHGIVRMVTLVKSIKGDPVKIFGGVIFTRADRTDINTLSDLKGKKVLAVRKSSLGGFLVAWEQFKHDDIDPFSDFSSIRFNGMPHDDVVLKVLDRQADAGTVRTSVLEQMAGENVIRMEDIKIINRKHTDGFPYIHSTRLYPEWPFARLPHVSDDLVEKVTVALLNIKKENPAAVAGRYDRWVPPLDYRAVHTMFKTLDAGPYEGYNTFTVRDVLEKYLKEILAITACLVMILIAMTKIFQLNRSLRKALSEVKTLQGFLPICSSCKKIRDDQGYWKKIETYIGEHSDATLSHGICPGCSEKLYGKESWFIEMKEKKS